MSETAYEGTADPAFASVAQRFGAMYGRRAGGGGALVIRHRGRTVVDVWKGYADTVGERPWQRDTLSLSFSTTKGVASTVIHRLADRGLIDYGEPVATYWPDFGAAGKARILVRELMSHRAGLQSVQALKATPSELLDHVAMEQRIASLPSQRHGELSAYHAFTYGWLMSGLARAVTGKGMRALVHEEIADPLGVDGLRIGLDDDFDPARNANMVGSSLTSLIAMGTRTARLTRRLPAVGRVTSALHLDELDTIFAGEAPAVWATEMPAVNGMFDATSLATMYGALANRGAHDGAEFLSPETVDRLGRIQVRRRDAVLGIVMGWRLGYHQALGAGRAAPRAFGHYGFGGSGGWADPDSGLSFGFVTNRIGNATTPMGDLALFRLSRLAVNAIAEHGATLQPS